MKEIINFYQEQARANLSTIPWLATLQEQRINELGQCGFPKRSNEDWKYTKIEPILNHRFSQAQTSALSLRKSDIPLQTQISIQNSCISDVDEVNTCLPAGVYVAPLFTALKNKSTLLQPHFDQILQHTHSFHALNTALAHTGMVIYLADNVVLEQPIVLSHWQDASHSIHNRHMIILSPGSQATIIEDYQGAPNCQYFTNTITEIFLAQEAQLSHYKIQREGRAAYHIGHTAVVQSPDSQFISHALNLGGKLVRSDLSVYLQGAGANCLLNGVYVAGSEQHIDQHTEVAHRVANCQSEQDYKGILAANARAVFNGKVIVAQGAEHTKARQQNKNLLLSEGAEIYTKPQLDIFADDVICTHGATVGQLDEEALFYFASRGIDRQLASNYLIQAFTADNFNLIPNHLLAQWMHAAFTHQLEQQL